MDELDVRIFRAIITERLSPPFSMHLKASLRQIARNLRVDDVTVRNRFKRFQEIGFLSGWRLLPNPSMFGYGYSVLLVDIPPRSSKKEEMIGKLKQVPGVVVILEYYGDSLCVHLFHSSEETLSQNIQLISEITSAERVTRFRVIFPHGEVGRLTNADWSIMQNMRGDAWKSHVQVAKELGFTSRTVKNRLQRLERLKALVIPPSIDIASLERTIGVVLFYAYENRGVKGEVDRAMLSRFDGSYLWARMTDPERAYLILVAPTMSSVKSYLDWTKKLQGVKEARAEIVVRSVHLWDKGNEIFTKETLLELRGVRGGGVR